MAWLNLEQQRSAQRISLSTMRWSAGLLLVLLVTVMTWGGFSWAPYERLEADYLDGLAQWTVAQSEGQVPESRLAVIDIDEASLDAFGPWPWPRHLTAQLIREAKERYHAPAVGVDILFPDTYGQKQEKTLQQALSLPGLVLAQAFDVNAVGEPPKTASLAGGFTQAALPNEAVAKQIKVATGYVGNMDQLVAQLSKTSGVRDEQAACVGHITPQPAKDGVVRHIAPVIAYQDRVYPMLTLTMLRCSKLQLESYRFAMNQQGSWQIPWTKALGSYTVVSAKDVLTGQVAPHLLDHRYLLIGSSALGVGDRVATPLGPVIPGVMVHAQVLSYLLDQGPVLMTEHNASQALPLELLRDSPQQQNVIAWVYSLSLVLGITLFLWHLNLVWALTCAVVGSGVWLLITMYLYHLHTSTAWILPWVTILLVMFFYLPLEWAIAQAQNRLVMRRLGAYLAPNVLRRLLAEGGSANLQPSRRIITILFVDIANFTAISEKLKPEVLGELTQAVLSELTESIHAHLGTLDKYMGDAVMAIWGAPLDQADHVDLALECAIDMQARVASKTAMWEGKYGLMDHIQIHVGINTGEVVVGEMGSVLRRTYTAIGDAVNIAARLQEQAKVWAHPILVGEASAQALTRHQLMRITALVLRGKHHPEAIYSLPALGLPKNLSVQV